MVLMGYRRRRRRSASEAGGGGGACVGSEALQQLLQVQLPRGCVLLQNLGLCSRATWHMYVYVYTCTTEGPVSLW